MFRPVVLLGPESAANMAILGRILDYMGVSENKGYLILGGPYN